MHSSNATTSRPLTVALLAAAMLGPILAGCEAPAFILSNVTPQEESAVYKPQDVKTVIFVDDPRRKLPNVQMNGVLANHIGHELKRKEIIADIVPPNVVDNLRMNAKDFNTWAIDKVGRQVDAKQVIYILVEEFDLGEDTKDVTYRPQMSVRVKVVDVDSGRRMFPEKDELGYQYVRKLFYKPTDTESRSADQMWTRRLMAIAGEEIAKLFYDHPPRGPSGTFTD
ncbi:MAG: hypothetical protein GC159_10080 [Phycisphaera sp.]|nr:hypothetical protein [Phycisphaera sp.]